MTRKKANSWAQSQVIAQDAHNAAAMRKRVRDEIYACAVTLNLGYVHAPDSPTDLKGGLSPDSAMDPSLDHLQADGRVSQTAVFVASN